MIDKIRIAEEDPVITLDAIEGYGEMSDEVDIYIKDIQLAPVGHVWETDRVHVTRSAHDQSAKLIFKDEDGAVLVITTRGWYDNPSGEMFVWRELVWVPFND